MSRTPHQLWIEESPENADQRAEVAEAECVLAAEDMDPSHIVTEFMEAMAEAEEDEVDDGPYLDDEERHGELPERIDPQTGFLR